MADIRLNFMSWLRQIVSNNIFLYKIWFYGVRKHKGDYVRLPSSEDDFYFDGYPRSGNTFFSGLLKMIFPNRYFASHLHSKSGLKIAIKLKLPILIIIRKPKDTVLSYLYTKVKNNDEVLPNHLLIKKLLRSYYNYYSLVKQNIDDDIYIINFDLCINNELLMAQQITEILKFKKKPEDVIKDKLVKFRAMMEEKEKQKKKSASSLPNVYRSKFKSKYENKVQSSPFYNPAREIYNELVEYEFAIPITGS